MCERETNLADFVSNMSLFTVMGQKMRITDADMQQIYINMPQRNFISCHEAKIILKSSIIMLLPAGNTAHRHSNHQHKYQELWGCLKKTEIYRGQL